MTYVITEPCIGEKNTACTEVCPVDCIYEVEDQFLINPEECIDCGAGEPECPVEAIYPGDEVPEEMEQYIIKAAEFDQRAKFREFALSATCYPAYSAGAE